MDSKPPISRAKMISITKSAIKAMKVSSDNYLCFQEHLALILIIWFCFSQLYKHVVQIVEKFIKKVRQTRLISVFTHFNSHQKRLKPKWHCSLWSLQCKPEYKVAGLYVVDSIVRQSRHQFGSDKDVFGPRFTKNITGTFENLCLCPIEDRVRKMSWHMFICDECRIIK